MGVDTASTAGLLEICLVARNARSSCPVDIWEVRCLVLDLCRSRFLGHLHPCGIVLFLFEGCCPRRRACMGRKQQRQQQHRKSFRCGKDGRREQGGRLVPEQHGRVANTWPQACKRQKQRRHAETEIARSLAGWSVLDCCAVYCPPRAVTLYCHVLRSRDTFVWCLVLRFTDSLDVC